LEDGAVTDLGASKSVSKSICIAQKSEKKTEKFGESTSCTISKNTITEIIYIFITCRLNSSALTTAGLGQGLVIVSESSAFRLA